MNKQSFFPRAGEIPPHNLRALTSLGLEKSEVMRQKGKDWERLQVCRDRQFILNAWEGYRSEESVEYTSQEHYLKVNFWLAGTHTTVLHGFGQHEHSQPEVLITAGPLEMLKIDLCSRRAHVSSLSLCVLTDFFPIHMGLEVDQLPPALRAMFKGPEFPFTFQRLPLTPELLAAARSILAAHFSIRRLPLYCQAKAVELMCLILEHMKSAARKSAPFRDLHSRADERLREAFEFISRHYAEAITLERISREAGLNRTDLTNGFRRLYGMSVYDFIQKCRMERAHELLQDPTRAIIQIAEAVGYRHPCNFSTAFRAYYGCTPQRVRRQQD